MGKKSAGRKKEKWLRLTENREGKTQASYLQYFIYLYYHVFKRLYSIYTEQTGTAFYAKEEGRQEKQRNKKLISAWKKHQDGKKPAWIYAEDGPNASKGKKTVYVLYTYLLINWTRNGNPFINWQSTGNQLTAHQPWISIQSPTKGTTQHERRQKQQNKKSNLPEMKYNPSPSRCPDNP